MSQRKPNHSIRRRTPLTKIDRWLREHWPIIWRTQVHYILPAAILICGGLFVAGGIYSSYQNNNIDLLVDPVEPIRLWEENYFQISLVLVVLFYMYWFSLEHKKSKIVLDLKRITLYFLAYFIGVAFLFLFCTNAFRVGIIYEHKVNKMEEEDIRFVRDTHRYFLFGEVTKKWMSWKDGEEAFYQIFKSENDILEHRYDADSLYWLGLFSLGDFTLEELKDTANLFNEILDVPKLSLPAYLSFWSSASQQPRSKLQSAIFLGWLDDFASDSTGISGFSYRIISVEQAMDHTVYLYRLVDTDSEVIDLSYYPPNPKIFSQLPSYTNLGYGKNLKALLLDTSNYSINNFEERFNLLVDRFEKDKYTLFDKSISSDTIVVQWKVFLERSFSIENTGLLSDIENTGLLSDIENTLIDIKNTIDYIKYYEEKRLSNLNERQSLEKYLKKKEASFIQCRFTQSRFTPFGLIQPRFTQSRFTLPGLDEFFYCPPPQVLELENRVKAVDHASLFFRKGVLIQFFWQLLPYTVLLALGLLLAPFLNLEYSFKSIFGITASLLLIYIYFSEEVSLTAFQNEGSPYIDYFLLFLGLGVLLLSALFFLKKHNLYAQYIAHILIFSSFIAAIFSLFHFDYGLQKGVQDLFDFRDLLAGSRSENTFLIFISNQLQLWWLVGLSTLITFVVVMLNTLPKQRL